MSGNNIFEGPNFFGGAPLTIEGGGGTITNATTLSVVSGGTVTPGGPGVALLSISGGGGGSYTAGLGIAFTGTSPTTIANTGTMVQPTQTNANGLTLYVQGSDITNSGTGSYTAGPFQGAGGAARLTNPAGEAIGGLAGATGGLATYGTASAYAANFIMLGGFVTGTGTVAGGAAYLQAGNAAGGTYNVGGDANINAGYGLQRGGDLVINAGGAGAGGVAGNVRLEPGTGATNGVLIVNNIGTVDPHILNAKWQTSLTGIGYIGVYSKG